MVRPWLGQSMCLAGHLSVDRITLALVVYFVGPILLYFDFQRRKIVQFIVEFYIVFFRE